MDLKIEIVKRSVMLEGTGRAGAQTRESKWKELVDKIRTLPEGEVVMIDPKMDDPKKVKSLGQQIKTAGKRMKVDIAVRLSQNKRTIYLERKAILEPPPGNNG